MTADRTPPRASVRTVDDHGVVYTALMFVCPGRGRLPYQTAINTGRLAVRTHTYDHPTEGPKVSTQVRVTPKGLAELHARLGGTGRLSLFTRTDVEVLSS